MSDSSEVLLRRQRVLADFGDFALQSEDLDAVLTEACRLVAEAMGTSRAEVLEIEPGGESLFVSAGVGWAPDVVGQMHIPMRENSSESFSIRAGKPVVTEDIRTKTRFGLPPFLKDAGVMALANVPIFLPGRRPYGLLQVDDTEPRPFDEPDTEFLRTYATILGPVIDRLLEVRELGSAEERFRLTVEAATDYAIFVTDGEDRITEWLPGAAAVFGWSAEEIVEQPASVLFTPEDRETGEPEKEQETARRQGHAPDVRWHLRRDGNLVFIEGAVWALHGPDGTPEGFLKVGQDVTKRQETDERLRASEDRLRTLLEGIPQLVWRSLDRGEWTWASPRWLAFTGQTQEQSHGQAGSTPSTPTTMGAPGRPGARPARAACSTSSSGLDGRATERTCGTTRARFPRASPRATPWNGWAPPRTCRSSRSFRSAKRSWWASCSTARATSWAWCWG